MPDISVSLVLLCIACGVLEARAGCPYQQCICERTYVICRDRNPTSSAPNNTTITPPTVDLNVASILLGGFLPANLTEIYLDDSPIKSISEYAFDDSAITLITLSMTNCSLTKIPDALVFLSALKYLTISDMNILDWNAYALSRIGPHVITLFLSNVGINIWPSWIKSFTNLTELSFEGSSLYVIPDGAFSMMRVLTSLSLVNNKLPAVPKALSEVTTLQSLYMEDNLISDITWLPKSSSLSTLQLGGNKLSNSTHISNALLPYANSLTDIDLQGNELTSIPELDFLTQVTSLDFSSNKLSKTNAGKFPATLDYLDLSSNLFSSIPSFILTLRLVPTLAMSRNYITEIRNTDFPPCIIFVQLIKNHITELKDTSFPLDSGILSLILDYNPISKVSLSAFANLSNLTYLSLRNSYLTRLPLALTSLKKLTKFDISDSRYLVCTCSEKGLDDWISLMSAETLEGDCGLTSIIVFFTMLSPRCPAL